MAAKPGDKEVVMMLLGNQEGERHGNCAEVFRMLESVWLKHSQYVKSDLMNVNIKTDGFSRSAIVDWRSELMNEHGLLLLV